MVIRVCYPTTRICAMCRHWNSYQGGAYVKPKVGMRRVMEYEPDEKQVCYRNSFEKKGWNSCGEWEERY